MPPDPSNPSSDARGDCSRRAFLGLAATAGLLGPTAVAHDMASIALGAPEDAKPAPLPSRPSLLALGLSALCREQRTWVDGHAGATLIAAHYFALDNELDERTARAHRAHVDAFVAKNPGDYPEPNPGTGRADPAKIAETLDLHVHELRSGGHDAIYAALALRALRDLPEYATPTVVEGICRLIGQHVRAYRPVLAPPHLLERPIPPCDSPEELAVSTFRAVLCPWNHVRRVGASGVLHWITHAEALVTLEELGYPAVARHGYTAQQLNVHLRLPHDEGGSPPERPAFDWRGAPYWESDAPRRLFQDSWLGGHAFKLPHSAFRLARRVVDEDLRHAALRRSALLLVPFESSG
jgi:hypothetical protein